jgi:hypothetical protein
MAFSRPTERTFKGRKEGMVPPKVIDREGKPIESPIGNGSDGVVELEVYRHKTQQPNVTKKAARWTGLRVDNLVEFKPENDYPDGGESIKDLQKVPEQLF